MLCVHRSEFVMESMLDAKVYWCVHFKFLLILYPFGWLVVLGLTAL